jgi:hypothetical protein
MYSAGHIGAHMDAGMPTLPSQRVELGSIEILPDGESFVIGLVGANQEMHRMEMPAWTVHQLMRVLPRLDFSRGIPAAHRTLVAVPTLLTDALAGVVKTA